MQKHKMPRDVNQRAKAIADTIDAILDGTIEPPTKDPERVARGKLGGSKGGTIRAAKLTPERRAEIARNAAAARWGAKTTE
jgi:hypothetical protein